MTQHSFYFQGIGSYDPTTGRAIYNVIVPKIDELTFHFDTKNIHIVIWNNKKCLMIYTQNGKDDDNYGIIPEVVQIEFTIPNLKEFEGGDIVVLVKHDEEKPSVMQRNIPTNGGKPGTLGSGIIRP